MSTTTNPLVLKIALVYLAQLRERQEAWDRMAQECAEHQPPMRPYSCIHGTPWHVDYDPICGPCEEGLSIYAEALIAAWADFHVWDKRVKILSAAAAAGAPKEALDVLGPWANAALEVLFPRQEDYALADSYTHAEAHWGPSTYAE